MKESVTTKEMLQMLQSMWDMAMKEKERFGTKDNHMWDMHSSWCIGAKEFMEALICAPVNLQLDGKVTIGYGEE